MDMAISTHTVHIRNTMTTAEQEEVDTNNEEEAADTTTDDIMTTHRTVGNNNNKDVDTNATINSKAATAEAMDSSEAMAGNTTKAITNRKAAAAEDTSVKTEGTTDAAAE